jgi:hypothetical protein
VETSVNTTTWTNVMTGASRVPTTGQSTQTRFAKSNSVELFVPFAGSIGSMTACGGGGELCV